MTKHYAGSLVCGFLALAAGCNKNSSAPAEQIPLPKIETLEEPAGPDRFAEVARDAGIDFAFRNGEDTSPHLSILESLGGGVALIDYDGDGRLDIYIPSGGYFDGPDKKQIKGHPGRLYRNLGNWKFADVTATAGLATLAGGAPWFYSHAATVADTDRDGWPDLLVSGWGRIALFRNVADGKGGRRFEDVSTAAGLDKNITWATSAAFADLDADGWPDLYVCEYVDWSFANHPKCDYDGKTFDVCPPKKFRGLQHKLYRNDAKGNFVDVTAEAGLKPGGDMGKGLGVLIVDVNADRKPDIYVANDTVDNFLYLNESTPGKIRLKETGLLAWVARDGNGSPNGSMGLDAGDPFGTGRPAIWVTNYENELHALYRNESKPSSAYFQFVTPASGIAAIGQKFVGWGTGFVDLDHDGWEDLIIANGHAIRYPTTASRKQRPVLFRNIGEGRFREITKQGGDYFRGVHLARGVALGDLDNDGHVDAVISHMNDPVAVLRSVAKGTNYWLGISLTGRNHADTVGATVAVEAGGRTQTRFVKGGGSYASAPDKRFVVGLGAANQADKIIITWPDGTKQDWTNVKPNRYIQLSQGEKDIQEPKPVK